MVTNVFIYAPSIPLFPTLSFVVLRLPSTVPFQTLAPMAATFVGHS